MIQAIKKIQAGWHMGVLTNIYSYRLFSFNAVAFMDHIYLRSGRVSAGGGGGEWGSKSFCFFLPGGLWGGLKQTLTISRGVKANYYFSITSS